MFYVGQKVTMKRSDWRWVNADRFACPQFGVVYTIRAIEAAIGDQWLLFNELRNPKIYTWDGKDAEPIFLASEFRPVVDRKTDISIFTAMLDTKKTKVPA